MIYTLLSLSESVWTSDRFTTLLTRSFSHFRHLYDRCHDSYGVTPNKVLSIMKDYLEPTFVVIFNLEAAVKISLLGWNTYRKFSRLATSGHFIVTSGITGMIYFLF